MFMCCKRGGKRQNLCADAGPTKRPAPAHKMCTGGALRLHDAHTHTHTRTRAHTHAVAGR